MHTTPSPLPPLIREVPYIGEFYGSTEGNATLINNLNKEGAVGYIPFPAQLFYPVCVVKFDSEREEPRRNPRTGFCEETAVDEAGELLGKIVDNDALRAFDGYTNENATSGKVLFDVFKLGDRWFRTGDLLTKDRDGYLYFVDRIGDTFRWKGE
jgi:fatty-acyl-CoA synthase